MRAFSQLEKRRPENPGPLLPASDPVPKQQKGTKPQAYLRAFILPADILFMEE
jgi:hypothetical protein